MGHLILNPADKEKQTYNKETDSRQVSGLIRRSEQDGKFYGLQMQENAINLLAELAIRGEHSADDIITGKVDMSEFNLYKKADDLVKLLAVSMRNDFNTEMNFEQLVENKIDSVIEHSDGTKEPANTFFYGLVNDSSMIENEFDKYMGKGAWREIDTAITQLHQPNISQEKFDAIFQSAQGLISEFANMRIQDKYKETVARDGINIPSLENKVEILNQMTGIEEQQTEKATIQNQKINMPDGYSINEFGEIIRPERPELQQNNVPINNNQLSLKQRIAGILQKNNLLMNVPFVENFVNKQLNVLPPPSIKRASIVNSSRQSFLDSISNNGKYRNLPPIQRMSDPEKMAEMRRKMEQGRQSKDNNDLSL